MRHECGLHAFAKDDAPPKKNDDMARALGLSGSVFCPCPLYFNMFLHGSQGQRPWEWASSVLGVGGGGGVKPNWALGTPT